MTIPINSDKYTSEEERNAYATIINSVQSEVMSTLFFASTIQDGGIYQIFNLGKVFKLKLLTNNG